MGDGSANLSHQSLIVVEVNLCKQHGAEDFVGFDEMMQVGARVISSGQASTVGINGSRILGVACILEVDGTKPGEGNQRYLAIKYSVRGRDLGSTVEEAMRNVGARTIRRFGHGTHGS